MRQIAWLVALSIGCGSGGESALSITAVSIVETPARAPWPPSKRLSMEIATNSTERCTGRLLPVIADRPPQVFELAGSEGKAFASHELPWDGYALFDEVEVTCAKATAKAPLALKMALFRDYSAVPVVKCHGAPCMIDLVTASDGSTKLQAPFDPLLSFELDGAKAAPQPGLGLVVRAEPAGGVAKLTTSALTKGVPLPGVLKVRYGKASASIVVDKLVASAQPIVAAHAKQLATSLASTATGSSAVVPGRTVLYLSAAGQVRAFGPERPIDSAEYLAVEQSLRQTRQKSCGTYAGAGGQKATFTVFLYDADVIVYDVAAKAVVGKRTFRGTGDCPRSFVSKGGQSGASGGYAESEQVAAFAATFAK